MCCLPDASTSDAGCCLRFRRPAPPRRLAVALSRVCGRLQRRPREARKGRPAGLRRRSQIRGRSLRRADAEESAVALAREESEHSDTADPDFCFHENGELSRHLPRGDQDAASGQIQQRSESPAHDYPVPSGWGRSLAVWHDRRIRRASWSSSVGSPTRGRVWSTWRLRAGLMAIRVQPVGAAMRGCLSAAIFGSAARVIGRRR